MANSSHAKINGKVIVLGGMLSDGCKGQPLISRLQGNMLSDGRRGQSLKCRPWSRLSRCQLGLQVAGKWILFFFLHFPSTAAYWMPKFSTVFLIVAERVPLLEACYFHSQWSEALQQVIETFAWGPVIMLVLGELFIKHAYHVFKV